MIIGASSSSLRRGPPRVLGPSELALREVIEPFLLAPEQLELVRALVGIDVHLIGGFRVRRVRFVGLSIPAEQAPQEPHGGPVYGAAIPGVVARPAGRSVAREPSGD